MTPADANLKPCPFCGKEPVLIQRSEWYAVACNSVTCMVLPQTDDGNKIAVTEAWNTRKGEK